VLGFNEVLSRGLNACCCLGQGRDSAQMRGERGFEPCSQLHSGGRIHTRNFGVCEPVTLYALGLARRHKIEHRSSVRFRRQRHQKARFI
jgi:hypothetical protein